MAPPSLSSGPDAPASVLPQDAFYEILLLLPAKDLCRLRCVCRAWRSLLSDPHLIAAHAARHPEPLIVLGYNAPWYGNSVLCDIIDLTGRLIKRVHNTGHGKRTDQWVVCTQPNLICVAKGSGMRCRLLNPTTGAVHALPEGLATEHAEHGNKNFSSYTVSTTFGLIPSTGEYKLLRLAEFYDSYRGTELCEILTVDGSSQTCWRGKQAPPYHVQLGNSNSVVIDGIIYSLLGDYNFSADQGLLTSFDLETEKWSTSIQGPVVRSSSIRRCGIIIAALSGCLVVGCRTPSSSMDSPSMDLWFLRDFEKGLWVKQHSIKISVLHAQHIGQPVLVLNDLRIANHLGNWAFLKIYNREIDSDYTGMVKNHSNVVGLYGGSLLSLANGN